MSTVALLITLLITLLAIVAGVIVRMAMSLPLGQFTASGDTFENI